MVQSTMPLYDATGSSTNFELHGSEQPETLVIKILELAGVAMEVG